MVCLGTGVTRMRERERKQEMRSEETGTLEWKDLASQSEVTVRTLDKIST